MIYSKEVLAFLEANKPEDESFPMPTRVLGARKTTEGKRGRAAFTSYGLGTGYATIFFDPKEGIKIGWQIVLNINDPARVVYEPFVSNTNGGSSRGTTARDKKPEEFLLEHFGIEKKEVALPEVVVQIPIPEWVKEEYFPGGDPWSNIAMVSQVCFVSEARQMIFEFKEKLGEIEDDLEKLPVKEVKETGKKFFLKKGVPYCKKCGEKIKLAEEFDEIQQCWIMRISCGESCVKFYQDYWETDISEGGLLSYLKKSGFFEEV